MWEKLKVFWTRLRASLPLIGLVVASACGVVIYYLIQRATGHDSSGPKPGTGSPKEVGFKTKEEWIKQFPNLVESDIKEANYLITDSYTSSSSKMKTAEKKGITIKTYGDFKL